MIKPHFYAEAKTLSDDSIAHDVKVNWVITPGGCIVDKSAVIHYALDAHEAEALTLALNDAVDSVLGKQA